MNRFFLVNQDSAGVFYRPKNDCEDPTRSAFQVAERLKHPNLEIIPHKLAVVFFFPTALALSSDFP